MDIVVLQEWQNQAVGGESEGDHHIQHGNESQIVNYLIVAKADPLSPLIHSTYFWLKGSCELQKTNPLCPSDGHWDIHDFLVLGWRFLGSLQSHRACQQTSGGVWLLPLQGGRQANVGGRQEQEGRTMAYKPRQETARVVFRQFLVGSGKICFPCDICDVNIPRVYRCFAWLENLLMQRVR